MSMRPRSMQALFVIFLLCDVSHARWPSDLDESLRNHLSIEPFIEWSTEGMGFPGQNYHATAESGKAHAIASMNFTCGAIHGTSTPSGSINGKSGITWPINAYFNTNSNNPNGIVVCSTETMPAAPGRVNIVSRCPNRGWSKVTWYENAQGDPVSSSAPNASYREACVKPLPYTAANCPNTSSDGKTPKTLFGNPVSCATRTKIQSEIDLPAVTPGGLEFRRNYRSDGHGWANSYTVAGSWYGTGTNDLQCIQATYIDSNGVERIYCFRLYRGWTESFYYRDAFGVDTLWWTSQSGLSTPTYNNTRVVKRVGSGATDVFTASNTVEQFDSSGRFTGKRFADGTYQIAEISTSATPFNGAPTPGYLISVTDQFGRKLQFFYNEEGRLSKLTGVDGAEYLYNYDIFGNVIRVRHPDLTTRQYLFNETVHTSGASLPRALTGIIDENSVRFATFKYDANGLALSTEHAGGVGKFTFDDAGRVTTPLGEVLRYVWRSNFGTRLLVADNVYRTCPTCPSETASIFSYDLNGNSTSSGGHSGGQSCYAYDLVRNLEIARLEGYPRNSYCPSNISAYQVPAGTETRKISTQYHPVWRLPVRVAAPGSITSWIYNGQPDPTMGDVPANCAPAGATVVDALPIAVVCKQIERATMDSTGNEGFSATPDPMGPSRIWTYTYNQYGQVLTEDGPRTDIGDITTYSYHPNTTANYSRGDLATVTNALGRVTTFVRYNRHGQVLEMRDPNNVVTLNTYDQRQRLKSSSIGGQTTSYDYDLAGQLKKVTRPDLGWVGYDYDDAHRLIAIYDELGNRVQYTLDNAGNRTAENVKDPAGNLRRTIARNFDALGRLQQLTGRP